MRSPPARRETLRRRALLSTTALFLIATGVTFAAQPAQAEFTDGMLAYQGADYERAYNEWLPLARAGNAAAQRNIGHLYRLGLGVSKDFKVAINWYRLAADQGLSRAQANLGVMYLRGEGIARNLVKAADWFNKAAEQGHVISQYNLALMLEEGYGVPRNMREAAKLFAEASDGGHGKAGDRLAAILAETVVPAAGPRAEAVAPATAIQTARSQDHLPTRIPNRQNLAPAQRQPEPAAAPVRPAPVAPFLKAEASPKSVETTLPAVLEAPVQVAAVIAPPPVLLRRAPKSTVPKLAEKPVPPTRDVPVAPSALPVVPLAPADKTPITAKPIPVFLQRETAGEHDDTDEPVIHFVSAAAAPRFLEKEAKTLALPAPTQTATVQPKPALGFLEGEAVPVLLRREADDTADAPRNPLPARSDTPDSAAALPKASKPDVSPDTKAEIPVFIREEAQTAVLAIVDAPRVGDPVGRVKRVTSLLADADEAAKERDAGAIPRYYQDRATLLAELEKDEDDTAPLPFLRGAPTGNRGAPIQPVPDFIVAEATHATRPVLPFINEEAASSAADTVVPGTGETGTGRLAALTTSRQTPVAAPAPRAVETAADRQAVNAGVAAYLGRNYEKAIGFWLPAAARGTPDAQFFVAGLFLDGNGVSRDLIQSHIWFTRSADQGHQRAREQLDLLRKIMTQAQFIEAEQRRTVE
jgi:TPR repeat protein